MTGRIANPAHVVNNPYWKCPIEGGDYRAIPPKEGVQQANYTLAARIDEMVGPEPLGHWSSLEGPNCGREHQFLRVGSWYRVAKAFVDFDGDNHEEGERWSFLGYSFLPYEDGMSWFVSIDGAREWHIRLQWRPEAQGEILDNLGDYVVEDGEDEGH